MDVGNRYGGDEIERRRFLWYLAGGLGAAWAARSGGALAQVAAGAAAGTPAAGPEAIGVTAGEIRIGMSAAFKGAIAGLGTDYYRGAMALYSELNAQGGIGGRRLRLVALDDGYKPLECLKNTIRLVEEEKVFVLTNYVGTPTLTRALPVIRRYRDRGIVLVGNLTGAQPQREEPYSDQVFNVRASYRSEMAATVEELWKLGIRKFGVFYQIDAYGRSGTDAVARALAPRGAQILAEATYRRGATIKDDMSVAVAHLKKSGVEAVLCTGAYQAAAAFIRDVRASGWNVPISNISFVGADPMLGLLLSEGTRTGKDLTKNIVNSQVVPNVDQADLAAVQEYRTLMDKWTPAVPAELQDPDFKPQKYSYNSLEGFLNARVLAEAIRRAGADLTRASLRAALESMGDFDAGIGDRIAFSPSGHQGLSRVFFTRVAGGRWVPVGDWKSAFTA